jgi:V-type H+-transporting ATPase subunit H
MSLDPPAYILSLQNNIRARPISWDGAVRAKTITDADLKKIKAIDKVRKEQRRQTIEGDTDTYVSLLLGNGETKSIFETTAKRTDILQYLLVLTGDLIEDIPTLVDALVNHPHPYKALLPLLKQSNNAEDPIPLLTSTVLSSLLSRALVAQPKSTPEIDEALPKTYAYIAALAKTSDSNLQDIAVQEYSALLRTSKSRSQFWQQRKETLSPLFEILTTATGGRDNESTTVGNGSTGTSIRSGITDTIKLGGGVGLQLLYHVLLAIWQLSFEGRLVGKGLDEDYDIVPLYTQLLRVSPKEKTTRLLLGTLHNLLSYNKSTLMPAALPAKLPTVLQNLKTRHFTDQDLLEDLDNLIQMLDTYTSSQTTLDEYAAEIESGHLRWSPPHKSADFWRENAQAIIDQENGALCKKLAEILSKDWASDKQVLAIGCNDVAFLVKECPEKRTQLEKFGLKARVMALMQDESEGVRWESLRAVGEWLRYSFEGQGQ